MEREYKLTMSIIELDDRVFVDKYLSKNASFVDFSEEKDNMKNYRFIMEESKINELKDKFKLRKISFNLASTKIK